MHTQLRYDSMTWVAGDWPFRFSLLITSVNDRTVKKKTKREAVLKGMAVQKDLSESKKWKNILDGDRESDVVLWLAMRASIYRDLVKICNYFLLHVLQVSCFNFGFGFSLDSKKDFVTRRFRVDESGLDSK